MAVCYQIEETRSMAMKCRPEIVQLLGFS